MRASKNKPKTSQKPSNPKSSKTASKKPAVPASKVSKGKVAALASAKATLVKSSDSKTNVSVSKTAVKSPSKPAKIVKSTKASISTKVVAKPAKSKVLAAKKPSTKTGLASNKSASASLSSSQQKAMLPAVPKKPAATEQAAKSSEKSKKIASAPSSNAISSKTKKPAASKLVASKSSVAVGPAAPQKLPAPKKEKLLDPPPSNTKPEIVAKIRQAQAEKELRKDLAQTLPKSSLSPITQVPPIVKGQDRLILMVRDPYWLHAHWDITRQSVDRAKASLAENWHTVKPILRLLKMEDSGTTSNAETVAKDIEIHGGVRNWYIEVDNPPSRFRMLMGYITAGERFYELARSNTVITPAPGGKSATDDHWADIAKDAEHIYAMSGGYGDDTQTGDLTEVFEEQLKRTMDADVLSQFGSGAEGSLKRHKHFHFDVDAELIVFGSTHPEAHVAVGTEPVKVRTDGSFSIRMPLPDRRQVLAATAKSRDGVDEQTVVIAVERNTKVMEPLSLDADDL